MDCYPKHSILMESSKEQRRTPAGQSPGNSDISSLSNYCMKLSNYCMKETKLWAAVGWRGSFWIRGCWDRTKASTSLCCLASEQETGGKAI